MEDYKIKYEKAIEQAKKELQACGSLNCDAARQIFRFFPELKESEDERIRKEIIQFLQLPHPQFVGRRNHEEWISWLENQGSISPTKDELEALRIAAYEPTKNWSEKLQSLYEKLVRCEQKASIDFSDRKTWKYIDDAVLTKEHGIGQYLDNESTEIMAKELQERFGNIMQIPAWSEEDELNLNQAIYVCHQHGYSGVEIWLKSFKERMKGE